MASLAFRSQVLRVLVQWGRRCQATARGWRTQVVWGWSALGATMKGGAVWGWQALTSGRGLGGGSGRPALALEAADPVEVLKTVVPAPLAVQGRGLACSMAGGDLILVDGQNQVLVALTPSQAQRLAVLWTPRPAGGFWPWLLRGFRSQPLLRDAEYPHPAPQNRGLSLGLHAGVQRAGDTPTDCDPSHLQTSDPTAIPTPGADQQDGPGRPGFMAWAYQGWLHFRRRRPQQTLASSSGVLPAQDPMPGHRPAVIAPALPSSPWGWLRGVPLSPPSPPSPSVLVPPARASGDLPDLTPLAQPTGDGSVMPPRPAGFTLGWLYRAWCWFRGQRQTPALATPVPSLVGDGATPALPQLTATGALVPTPHPTAGWVLPSTHTQALAPPVAGSGTLDTPPTHSGHNRPAAAPDSSPWGWFYRFWLRFRHPTQPTLAVADPTFLTGLPEPSILPSGRPAGNMPVPAVNPLGAPPTPPPQDWLDVEGHWGPYLYHPLELLLRWLDRVLVVVETALVWLWKRGQRIMKPLQG